MRFESVVLGWGLLVLLSSGCFSRFRQAEELIEKKQFVQAADILEEISKADPENADVRRVLERTRFQAVEQQLKWARETRLTGRGEASRKHFAKGLGYTERWKVKLNGALMSTIEDELDDATRFLRDLILPKANAGFALTAESHLTAHAFLLKYDVLSKLREELSSAVMQSGTKTCRKLIAASSNAQPHFTELAGRYCRHFQHPSPPQVVLAETFSGASTLVTSSTRDGLAGQLESYALAAFARSPWYATDSNRRAEFVLGGSMEASQRQDWAPLTASWLERVPYEVDVVRELSQSVPVQECEISESVDAKGRRQAYGREVTRQKTSTRQVVVRETRFRDVPRVFNYQALRIERVLVYSAKVELRTAQETLASLGLQDRDSSYGFQHDVVFGPAGISPQRVRFFSADDWANARTATLAANLLKELQDAWRVRYCASSAFSQEEASRCVRVGENVPAGALRALEPALGEDAQKVVELYTTS